MFKIVSDFFFGKKTFTQAMDFINSDTDEKVKNKTIDSSLSLDGILLFKLSIVALFSLYFLIELGVWQTILAKDIFYIKACVLLAFCSLYFMIYHFKRWFSSVSLILWICILDTVFVGLYAFYSPIPLNLLVGVLSLNILIAGFTLPLISVALVTSLSVFVFSVFLSFRGLLETDYSVFYFILNTFSFVIYAGASNFLKNFFFQNQGELKILSKHLFKQRELNKAVLSSIDAGVFITGHGGKPIALNENARKVMSASLEDSLQLLSVELKNTTSVVKEVSSLGRHYKVYGSSLKSGLSREETSQNVLLVNDETESIKLQKELEEARKLSAIGTLSAGLAHEIRNPLAGISGSIELIKEGSVDEQDSKKLFNTVLREIDRLNLLVTDFLNFAQPEVSADELVEISEFIKDIELVLNKDPRFQEFELKISCEPEELMMDKHKLHQVFLNLIINAFQSFSHEQKEYLKEQNSACRVTVTGQKFDEGYCIKVQDNGRGIKKSELNRIFEPFHTTKDKGTGLGLALTHRILEGHGARVSVESELKQGTIFTMFFK